jgi:hypothetical protein
MYAYVVVAQGLCYLAGIYSGGVMKTPRWLLKLGLALLVFGLSALAPKPIQADVNCYDAGGGCTICDFWTGQTYNGYLKKCAN